MSKPSINVLCDLVRRKSYVESYEIDADALQLSCDEKEGNVYLKLEEIEAWMGARLSAASRDLAEIAAYIYQADKGIRRGQGDRWTRHFSMLIPVRLLEVWTNLGPQLSRTLFELTGDKFDFYFVAKGIDKESAFPTKSPERTKEGSDEKSASDCVCLFSGGLDGFAGVTELAGRRRRPILVSHYINNLKPIQHEQVQALGAAFDHEFEHLQFRVGPRNIEEKTKRSFVTVENTQRSRSFLFLAMAAIVAFERTVDELFICENGVLAINLPLTPSRLGSRSTRSTHPHFLKPFQDVVSQLFGSKITIRNPFTFKTKKEVVEVVTQTELKKQLHNTVSCWGFPRRTMGVPDTKHCGYCLPCIHRRIAFIAAGYERWDDNYKTDIFNEYKEASTEVTVDFRDLLTFAANIDSMSMGQLIYSHPGLLVEVGELCDTAGEEDSVLLAEMLKRYSAEVLRVAKKRARGALKQWGIPDMP
jgi:7-cyano-7-deazaguanine synthase in queuosine biosynthesis